jgi:hypothetical protein
MGRFSPEDRAWAREVLRLAKQRGAKLPFNNQTIREDENLAEFLRLYRDPASDRQFKYANDIAESLSVELTAEQKMNKFHCSKFIEQYKETFE